MAGDRTKDISLLTIKISPTDDSYSSRTLTNIANYNSGASENKIEKREPDTQGVVFLKKIPDKSRNPTLSVKIGTTDEKYIDNLIENTVPFNLTVIDESNNLYKKQETGTECYFEASPEDDKREGDNREYSIIASEYKVKAI